MPEFEREKQRREDLEHSSGIAHHTPIVAISGAESFIIDARGSIRERSEASQEQQRMWDGLGEKDWTHHLVREDDHTVYADSGYLGIEKRDEIKNDEHLSQVEYRIAARPSQNRLTNRYGGFNGDKKIEHDKSSVRCKVEHPFHIVKNFFHCAKTRYRGLKKNLHMFHILFASANLLMCARSGRQKIFALPWDKCAHLREILANLERWKQIQAHFEYQNELSGHKFTKYEYKSLTLLFGGLNQCFLNLLYPLPPHHAAAPAWCGGRTAAMLVVLARQ